MKALFDTNILLDYLNGIDKARSEIERYRHRAISMVSWMEVMVGTADEHRQATESFLASFQLVDIDKPVAEEAVRLRRLHRLMLPDAIVWASARVGDWLLVTRDAKDLPADDPGVRIPYRL